MISHEYCTLYKNVLNSVLSNWVHVLLSMANRRTQGPKQKLPPKPKEILLNINIWEDRLPTSSDQGSRSRLEDLENHLEANNFHVEKAHEPVTGSGNARHINIKLKTRDYGNLAKFFEHLRRQWCSFICRRGDSLWLESGESVKGTFKYKSDKRQVLQATSFSFGSFFDRGTFIRHWSSDENASEIEVGTIQSEFEHDTKTLAITFSKAGFPVGNKVVSIEMEYRQLEDYVVIDENVHQGTIHFYFPLQWPPKVSQGN